MHLGYACINNSLAEQGVQVNRSLIRRTFIDRGISYASSLALKNVLDLSKVIDWNIEHKIFLYRMSSDMFPWMSEYEFSQLPDIDVIAKILKKIGDRATENNLRLTFHPGPFNVLASPNEVVVNKTIKELRQHAEIMDMMNLPQSPAAKINIHIGGSYGDKTAAIRRFILNFQQLPANVQRRLTIENDDKVNMFSVADLTKVSAETGVPVVFDFLHHQFCTGGLTEREAFFAALDTWPREIVPVVHVSSSKKRFEDKTALETAHADFIYGRINLFKQTVDVMLEAKAKEQAIFRYRKEYRLKAIA